MHNTSPRLGRNNFDLLRLVFATTVCLVHTYAVSGYGELRWLEDVLSTTVAVNGFFVVSGFLIFMSCERSASLGSYAGKRVRRIYPAYFVVVMACAFFLVAASSRDSSQYYSVEWMRYLLANLAFLNFLQPNLPGVFEGHPIQAVNAALWTLKIEVMFYATAPIFVMLFRRFGHFVVLAVTYACSVGYVVLLGAYAESTGSELAQALARQLPGQLSYFMAGAFFYYFLELFVRRMSYFVLPALLVLLVNTHFALPVLEPFALGTVVAFAALFAFAGNFARHGDFSYGIYIVHFPLIQLLYQAGWFEGRAYAFLMASILASFGAAALMWHLVEKRFLARGNHYVQAEAEQG